MSPPGSRTWSAARSHVAPQAPKKGDHSSMSRSAPSLEDTHEGGQARRADGGGREHGPGRQRHDAEQQRVDPPLTVVLPDAGQRGQHHHGAGQAARERSDGARGQEPGREPPAPSMDEREGDDDAGDAEACVSELRDGDVAREPS